MLKKVLAPVQQTLAEADEGEALSQLESINQSAPTNIRDGCDCNESHSKPCLR